MGARRKNMCEMAPGFAAVRLILTVGVGVASKTAEGGVANLQDRYVPGG